MREILFRGKRTDNSKWVYGLLARYNPEFETANMVENEILIPVTTRTVGQYIGRTDKNGIKIFEGDIIHIEIYSRYTKPISEGNCQVVLKDCKFGVNWLDDWYITPLTGFCDTTFEIIGSIHDNPELLKGE